MASFDFIGSFLYEQDGNSLNYQRGSFDDTDGVLTDSDNDGVFVVGEEMFEDGNLVGTFKGTFTDDGGNVFVVVETVPSSGANTGEWKIYAPEGADDVPPKTIGEDDLDDSDYIVPCFVAGTLIQTDLGKRPIEDLKPGDLVQTMDHGFQPIRWIGSRKLDAVDLALKPTLLPICIRAGALGKNVPSRDLIVSPQHRVLLSGWREELLFGEQYVLAAAKHLVNGETIYQHQTTEVEYFHMLFDQHEIVLAENAHSESFHPGDYIIDKMDKNTRNEIFEIFPELRDNASAYGPTVQPTLKQYECMMLQTSNNRLHIGLDEATFQK